MSTCQDLMAVRKIPLKQRPYLLGNVIRSNTAEVAAPDESIDNSRNPDPSVQETLALVRKKVLSDRALHDKVSLVTHTAAYYLRCQWGLRVADVPSRPPPPPFPGRGGVRLVCQGVLQARSRVHFPDQEAGPGRGCAIVWTAETPKDARAEGRFTRRLGGCGC